MDASNTPADRAANPSDYRQLRMGKGSLVVMIRNDLGRDVVIR